MFRASPASDPIHGIAKLRLADEIREADHVRTKSLCQRIARDRGAFGNGSRVSPARDASRPNLSTSPVCSPLLDALSLSPFSLSFVSSLESLSDRQSSLLDAPPIVSPRLFRLPSAFLVLSLFSLASPRLSSAAAYSTFGRDSASSSRGWFDRGSANRRVSARKRGQRGALEIVQLEKPPAGKRLCSR